MAVTRIRSRNLADYDGAPLRNATLPHPVELKHWIDTSLIRIDADMGVLRLTALGRAHTAGRKREEG